MAFPRELGGGGPIGTESYADLLEEKLRRALGVGLYSAVRDSDHGEHRHTLATAMAYGQSAVDAITYETQPATALWILAEWEYVLGLGEPREGWGYEERWTRIRARLLEVGGNSTSQVLAVFELLTGRDCKVVSDATYKITPTLVWPPNRSCGSVIVEQDVYDDAALWIECQRTRRRLRPAGGDIYVVVTKDSAMNVRPQFRCGESLLGRDAFGLNP